MIIQIQHTFISKREAFVVNFLQHNYLEVLYCLSDQLNVLRIKMNSDCILRQDTEEGFTEDTIEYVMSFSQNDYGTNYSSNTFDIVGSVQRKTPSENSEVYCCQDTWFDAHVEYTISARY